MCGAARARARAGLTPPPRPAPRPQDVVFPKWDEVKPEHVVPGMRALLATLHKEIDTLEASVAPTWEGLVEPLERISDRHQRTWGVVSHLKVSSSWGWGGALLSCLRRSQLLASY